MNIDPRRSRERMVREQIQAKGVTDEAVLRAMGTVPRHLFLPEALESQAYEDHPVPIGSRQTISQPYMVAWMSELLEARPGMSVLEIGTGSGYQAAVLAEMELDVSSVERIRGLYMETRKRLARLGYYRIRLKLADGTLGWPEYAPFDRIILTAGGPSVPDPLVEQLADPGILVMPLGSTRRNQQLVRVVKKDGKVRLERKGAVAFVDLVGKHGWEE